MKKLMIVLIALSSLSLLCTENKKKQATTKIQEVIQTEAVREEPSFVLVDLQWNTGEFYSPTFNTYNENVPLFQAATFGFLLKSTSNTQN